MFGIDQISWGRFGVFIAFILLLWYLAVIFRAWSKGKNRNRKLLFEDDFFMPVSVEKTGSVSVSSQDYPAQLIPYRLAEDIPLPVSFYEESGLDEGYAIASFSEPNNPDLPQILEQIQFQQ